MKQKKQVAILIPIYKPILSDSEEKSLKQCIKVLGSYPIIFICGFTFDVSYYYSFVNSFGIEFKSCNFNDKYFCSLEGYNELCLSPHFYMSFSEFEYIHIYQLDAWVFRNELDYWCNKGYDYIGAPWYDDWGMSEDINNINLLAVGNGGFSLRKVESFIKLLNRSRLKPLRSFRRLCNDNILRLKRNPLLFILYFIKALGYKNNLQFLLNQGRNEDGFLFACTKLGNLLKMPDVNEALAFAFELHPSISFKKNNEQLPFGCHAWLRYEYESFWKQYIN